MHELDGRDAVGSEAGQLPELELRRAQGRGEAAESHDRAGSGLGAPAWGHVAEQAREQVGVGQGADAVECGHGVQIEAWEGAEIPGRSVLPVGETGWAHSGIGPVGGSHREGGRVEIGWRPARRQAPQCRRHHASDPQARCLVSWPAFTGRVDFDLPTGVAVWVMLHADPIRARHRQHGLANGGNRPVGSISQRKVARVEADDRIEAEWLERRWSGAPGKRPAWPPEHLDHA